VVSKRSKLSTVSAVRFTVHVTAGTVLITDGFDIFATQTIWAGLVARSITFVLLTSVVWALKKTPDRNFRKKSKIFIRTALIRRRCVLFFLTPKTGIRVTLKRNIRRADKRRRNSGKIRNYWNRRSRSPKKYKAHDDRLGWKRTPCREGTLKLGRKGCNYEGIRGRRLKFIYSRYRTKTSW